MLLLAMSMTACNDQPYPDGKDYSMYAIDDNHFITDVDLSVPNNWNMTGDYICTSSGFRYTYICYSFEEVYLLEDDSD